MKKLLSVIFAVVLIFSCFAVTAFAEDVALVAFEVVEDKDEVYFDTDEFPLYDEQPIISFSDDFSKLYVDGEPFSRADLSMLSTDFGYTVITTRERDLSSKGSAYLELTDPQKNAVTNIYIETNLATTMYRIEFYYGDGSSLCVYFLKDTLFEDYEKIISGNADKYLIDFQWPDGNIVTATKNQIKGETVNLSEFKIFTSTREFFYVDCANENLTLSSYVGIVCLMDDTYYYIDYKENNIEEAHFLYGEEPRTDVIIKLHKITDEALNTEFQLALEKYYSDDYGIFYDDDASETISAIFLIITFGVLPFVVFIIFLIKAIRGKGVYKKLYGTVSALCIAEVIVFVILAVIIGTTTPADATILGGSDDELYMQLETDVDFSNKELYLVKEAYYCGDGDCTDGCTTGYFYCNDIYYIDNAMSELGLGEPNGYDEYYSEETMQTSIIVGTRDYENGYMVEYEVIGVG